MFTGNLPRPRAKNVSLKEKPDCYGFSFALLWVRSKDNAHNPGARMGAHYSAQLGYDRFGTVQLCLNLLAKFFHAFRIHPVNNGALDFLPGGLFLDYLGQPFNGFGLAPDFLIG